ncbi:MAG TPA: exodeoxyribonuclease VII small subunit [Anaerolineae bacterium]|nr:exodeoxyribonuclease VII small subunit [Anaerolineae bacterium]HNU04603.1 exodeoxyribonuclease VII small subunit [Anaerolineae bacterium]
MEEPTFEQAYTELERVTRALEAGDLPLDAALALFEQGAQLAEQCDRLLAAAELRVRQILPDGVAPFDQGQEETG